MGAWICSVCVQGREEQPLPSFAARHCDECGKATEAGALHHVSIGEIRRKARADERASIVLVLQARANTQRDYHCPIANVTAEELERIARQLSE